MTIVMLAAGTSSRMGKVNKMLLSYNQKPMVLHCCLEALSFLEEYSLKNDVSCTLIVVTGYKRRSVEKAIIDCKSFIEKTSAKLSMLIVNNENYKNGQFSSTKVGVSHIQDDSFFISLADMPLVNKDHYNSLIDKLEGFDAVRPFYDKTPGHPVLHAPSLKDKILKEPDTFSVRDILKNLNVNEVVFSDLSYSLDIDTVESYNNLIH